MVCDGSEAHGRNVEAQILVRLAHLDDHGALVAELSAAHDRGIGAVDAFHGQHRLVLDHQALADIQMSEAFGQLPAEGNVVFLAPVWLATRQDPLGGEERREQNGGGFDVDAFRLQFPSNGSENRIVFFVAELVEEFDGPPVGANARVNSGLVDRPGHCRAGDPRLLEGSDQPIELAQFEQVEFLDVVGQGSIGFALEAHGNDLQARLCGGMSKKERKLSAPCNQSDSVKLPLQVSKRPQPSVNYLVTPRLERPCMNWMRFSTSGIRLHFLTNPSRWPRPPSARIET